MPATATNSLLPAARASAPLTNGTGDVLVAGVVDVTGAEPVAAGVVELPDGKGGTTVAGVVAGVEGTTTGVVSTDDVAGEEAGEEAELEAEVELAEVVGMEALWAALPPVQACVLR